MNVLVQILGSVALGAVLAAIVTGLFSKRKLSAEATDIITKAASGVVERLEAENARVIADRNVQAGEIATIKHDLKIQDQALAVHAFWDRQAFNTLKEHGIELPEPPPLHPAQTN